MEVPTYVSNTALPQGQQGSSDLPPSRSSSQVNAEAPPEEGALQHVCSPCRTSFAQRQGLTRHIQEFHNPSLCLLCEFKWGRRYVYRDHLRTKHPGVDPDMILGKAPRPRRSATTRTEHVPQQQPVSLRAVEQDQQNWAESQRYSSAPPFPAGAKVTSVSPHAVSPVDYNLQPVYAEQTVIMDEHEHAHVSLGLLPAHPGASAATHSPSNPETPPMCYSPFSAADIDAAFNSILTNSTL